MSNASRLVVAGFTVWLTAVWTIPVCCLSMTTSVATAMTGHQHHHHASGGPGQASRQFTAPASRAPSCQTGAIAPAISLPYRNDAAGVEQMAATVSAIGRSAPVSFRSAGAFAPAPPGLPSPMTDRSVPLRI